MERNVARKELLNLERAKQTRGGASIYQRFLREARITAGLEHPGIVPVYELGEREDGTIYYTMKEVQGRTLKDALAECATLTERMQLLGHFLDFCQAIGYAHSQGIIHRDIKPDNVMIDRYGETIVLDWGLAKAIQEKELPLEERPENSIGKTRVGFVMGTPHYMSPEQAFGSNDRVDSRSDVWSLGIVLYEILSGKTPFDGKTSQEIIAQVQNNTPPST